MSDGSSSSPVASFSSGDGLHPNDLAPAPSASGASPSSSGASASSQLVSWPVALQCARDRMRAGPVIAFSILLALTGLFSSSNRSAASIFGGLTLAHGFMLGLTLLLAAGLISEELESGHAQLVLLRPLSRAAFFGGRLAGAGLVLLGAMGITWLLACGVAAANGFFNASYLLALPVAFVWAFSWLALIGAISSVARGSTNSLWILFSSVLWFIVKSGLAVGGALASAWHKWPWLETVHQAANATMPYIGPQDPTDLVEQVAQHAHLDLAPLLYDLIWLTAMWTLGAWLFNQRELARRRS